MCALCCKPSTHTDGSDVEKAAFLTKPVQLTPAWEANNLPNDELNFKGMFVWLCVCVFVLCNDRSSQNA